MGLLKCSLCSADLEIKIPASYCCLELNDVSWDRLKPEKLNTHTRKRKVARIACEQNEKDRTEICIIGGCNAHHAIRNRDFVLVQF